MPKVRIVLQAATVCTKAAGALYIPLFRFSFFFLSFFLYSGSVNEPGGLTPVRSITKRNFRALGRFLVRARIEGGPGGINASVNGRLRA